MAENQVKIFWERLRDLQTNKFRWRSGQSLHFSGNHIRAGLRQLKKTFLSLIHMAAESTSDFVIVVPHSSRVMVWHNFTVLFLLVVSLR